MDIRQLYNYIIYVLDSFFFQAEDGIRDLVRSRGLGDVYKRQDVIGVQHAVGIRHLRPVGFCIQPLANITDITIDRLSLIHI